MRSMTKLLATSVALALSTSVEAQHFRLPSFQPPQAPHRGPGDTFNLQAFNAPAPPPGFAPGVGFAGGGPNIGGQGFYQAPNAWNGGWGYAAPPSPNGNQYTNGYLGQSPAGQVGGYQYGQYGNGQAMTMGVQGGYQGPNAWGFGMGGVQSGPHGDQFTNGGFSRGPNGYTSTFGVTRVDPRGQSTYRGGTMTYQNPNNWGLGTTFTDPNGRAYGLSTNQRNGITTVGAQGSAPGALPGTRVGGHGDMTFRGRDTFFRGGGNVTDTSGMIHLGGGDGMANRQGISGVSNAGLGNVHGTQTDDLRFRGGNSTYSRQAQGTIPGIGTAQQNFAVSRNGASFNTGVSVGGRNLSFGGRASFP